MLEAPLLNIDVCPQPQPRRVNSGFFSHGCLVAENGMGPEFAAISTVLFEVPLRRALLPVPA
jgi:hypothetical protein